MTKGLPHLDPVAFVLGVPRSGTTLLRVMLAGHPALFCPPEMVLAPFETMKERETHLVVRSWERGGLRRALMDLQGLEVVEAEEAVDSLRDRRVPEVYAHLQRLIGARRLLVDKCPHLSAAPDALRRIAEWFPQARYLWLMRHPGSVIRSLEHLPMSVLLLRGYAASAHDAWQGGNQIIEAALSEIPRERWEMIRYEELVSTPRPVMERACEVLGVPFDQATLDPYEGDRMREGPRGARAVGDPGMAARGRIDPALATSWLRGFDGSRLSAEARELASKYGYEVS